MTLEMSWHWMRFDSHTLAAVERIRDENRSDWDGVILRPVLRPPMKREGWERLEENEALGVPLSLSVAPLLGLVLCTTMIPTQK